MYWWHVLDEEGMLQYTTGVLPDYVGATVDSAPLVLTNSSEKNIRKDNGSGYDQNVLDKIRGLSRSWDESNLVQRKSNALQKERMKFEQDSFSKKITLEEQRMKFDQDSHSQRISIEQQHRIVEQMGRVREWEREIEQFEDEIETMQDGENPNRKRCLQDRISNLKRKIQSLDEK